jgi:hypothetical protein
MSATETTRRDWNWDVDGELDGMYVAIREVTIKNGPSAGQSKLVFDFHFGLEDELVSVWETAVIRSEFDKELKARRKPDFEPGERITITPKGFKEGQNGKYRAFEFTFEHAAPKRSAAELLASRDEPDAPDDVPRATAGGGVQGSDIPFGPSVL